MSHSDQPNTLPLDPCERGGSAFDDPEYLDESASRAALLTAFDTCDACRKCVGRCAAFPALFDLIDESKNLSAHDVPVAKWAGVLDRCHLCSQCLSSCPYASPNSLALNVPQVMLRAKAVRFDSGKVPLSDRLLSRITQAPTGMLRWPGLRHVVGAGFKYRYLRRIASSATGLDLTMRLSPWRKPISLSLRAKALGFDVSPAQPLPVQVLIDASADGVDVPAELAEDLLKILHHNSIGYTMVDLQLGSLRSAAVLGDTTRLWRLLQSKLPVLAQYARQGVGILILSPSNAAMLKVTLPSLFAHNDDMQTLKRAVCGPMEYFHARQVAGLLKKDFQLSLGQVNLHVACGSQAFGDGQAAVKLLSTIPDTVVNLASRCSGHGCGWGFKKDFTPMAIKFGKPLFSALAQGTPDFIATECNHASQHIGQGMEHLPDGHWQDKRPEIFHPLRLLCMAYGL